MRCWKAKQGDILFKKGDSANFFYIILSGSVNIYMPRDQKTVKEEIEYTKKE